MSNDLGLDRSGNGNNWTVNNITFNDQMVDSPTNNFATFNSIGWQWSKKSAKMSEGNLSFGKDGTDWTFATSTQTIPQTEKIYFEVRGIDALAYVGIALANENSGAYDDGSRPDGGWVKGLFSLYVDGNTTAYAYRATTGGTPLGTQGFSGSNFNNAVIGVAVDIANSNIKFFINNVQILSQSPNNVIDVNKDYVPLIAGYTTLEMAVNFGQDSSFAGAVTSQGNQDANDIGDFFYAPPSGYLALCTKNFPDVAVVPNKNFKALAYTGAGANQVVSGVGFTVDLLWLKNRSLGYGHNLLDSPRGLGTSSAGSLSSDSPASEGSFVYVNATSNTGFTTTSQQYGSNNPSSGLIAWCWKANGAGASNTNGSINTTKTSANVDAGFSIITYSGNGTAGATIGHGLAKAPEMFIIKSLTVATDWWDTYHYAIGANYSVFLNDTLQAVDRSYYHDTHPTSSLIYLGSDRSSNGSGQNFVCYAFHSVDGYCKVGSYIGNGSNDGTFVWCGHRPSYVMIKNTDDTDNWYVADNARDNNGNPMTEILNPNSVGAEYTTGSNKIDFVSNGFKCRDANSGDTNINGEKYIFISYAKSPSKYSNAR